MQLVCGPTEHAVAGLGKNRPVKKTVWAAKYCLVGPGLLKILPILGRKKQPLSKNRPGSPEPNQAGSPELNEALNGMPWLFEHDGAFAPRGRPEGRVVH
jgi:hypothetical protein